MRNRLLIVAIIGFCSFTTIKETKASVYNKEFFGNETNTKVIVEDKSMELYESLQANGFSMPNFNTFSRAIEGYLLLQQKNILQNEVLTIVDFDLPSTQKRLWVIDMNQMEIVYHSLVAHGKNSGTDKAVDFSNENESYKSSLGFYLTNETYMGSHGLSLRLDGLEKNKNDNARNRAIVMHGADYVSANFIKNHQRLGRSFGCPALPIALAKEIIGTIKNKSCLYIHHQSDSKTTLAI